jgi:ATP-dependent protease Clp ATPase subunit
LADTTNSQIQSTINQEHINNRNQENNTLSNIIPNEVQSVLQSILPSLVPSTQTNNNNITPSLSNNQSNNITNSLQNPNNGIIMVYEDLTQQQGLSLTEIHQVSELMLNEISSEEEEPKICSICQQNLEWDIIIRKINECNHEYHVNCIDRWLVDHTNCPTCRRELVVSTSDNNNLQRTFSQTGLSSYQFRIPRNNT